MDTRKKLCIWVIGSMAMAVWADCRFDPLARVGSGGDAGRDGVVWWDASRRDGGVLDGAPRPDGSATDATAPDSGPVCVEGAFECVTPTSARICAGGTWTVARRCFLGCVSSLRECRDPSNVDSNTLGFSEEELGGLSQDDDLVLNTDTGEIRVPDGAVIRPANQINRVEGGIGFYRVNSGTDLGIFVLSSWTIPARRTVSIQGTRALVVLVTQDATILGRIDAGAHGVHGGPGGFDGGPAGQPGSGPCHGSPGMGTADCSDLCSSGSGGGGHGGAGGAGGAVNCDDGDYVLSAGAGGQVCGSDDFQHLVGGGGGAGGESVLGHTYDSDHGDPGPGPGGGGGGAVQISVRGRLVLGVGGGILVPGAGGGETTSGGGAGGGAGGAILLEAGEVVAEPTAFLAANGGGGGGGDCT